MGNFYIFTIEDNSLFTISTSKYLRDTQVYNMITISNTQSTGPLFFGGCLPYTTIFTITRSVGPCQNSNYGYNTLRALRMEVAPYCNIIYLKQWTTRCTSALLLKPSKEIVLRLYFHFHGSKHRMYYTQELSNLHTLWHRSIPSSPLHQFSSKYIFGHIADTHMST